MDKANNMGYKIYLMRVLLVQPRWVLDLKRRHRGRPRP